MMLMEQVERYVALKRALGLSYAEPAQLLRTYAAQADAHGDTFVIGATVLDWASRTSSNRQARKRLCVVRGFAAMLHAEDPRHEVPSADYFGKRATRRKAPNLLSPGQLGRIMDAALALPPAGSITPLTFHYMLGLIAATGLRRSEAIKLLLTDITPDGLHIRNTKFGGNRLVPLDDSVCRAIDEYFAVRKQLHSLDEHLFVLSTGRSVSPHYLTSTFIKLAREVGVRGGPGEPGPRLHDLRHGFAVRALESVECMDRKDIGRHMLALSTYLGHASVANTYWYLEATPVLLGKVSDATERLHAGRRDND